MPVKDVPTLGWTRRSAGVTVLLAMQEHRRQIGARIVQLREAREWSQEDLAHHSGLSVKTISRLENGTHEGRRSTFAQVAKALKVKTSVLVGDPPSPLALGYGDVDPQAQLDRIEQVLTQLQVAVATLAADNLRQEKALRALLERDRPEERPGEGG